MSTDPRISRRRRAVTRSRHRRIIVRFSVLILIAGLVYAAFFSPLLVVGDVKVLGAEHVSPEEVAAAAAIGADQNLLLMSTEKVKERVESLPWVAGADVDRMLPGTIRIRVEERVPAMILSLGAARWTIDSSGHVLTSGEAAKGLPVIVGAKLEEVEPGKALESPEITGALSAWLSLPDGLRAQVTAIIAPAVESITLSLSDGTLIRYGAPEDIAAKNEVLQRILERLKDEGTTVEYIDVRVPSHPALGPTTGDDDAGA